MHAATKGTFPYKIVSFKFDVIEYSFDFQADSVFLIVTIAEASLQFHVRFLTLQIQPNQNFKTGKNFKLRNL